MKDNCNQKNGGIHNHPASFPRTPSLLIAPSNSRIEGRNCCFSSLWFSSAMDAFVLQQRLMIPRLNQIR